jgi:chromosome segregation ATPase
MMKLDIKSITIGILFLISLTLATLWYFSSDGYKKEVRKLKAENRKIEGERKSIMNDYVILKSELDRKMVEIETLKSRGDSLNGEILKKEIEIQKGLEEISKVRAKWIRNKKEVDKLKNNPIRREGNDLLESIRQKTK